MNRTAQPVNKFTATMLGLVAFLIIIRAAVIIFIPENTRVWGLDYPKYILSWDVWLALLIPLLFCIPVVAQWIAALFSAKTHKHSWPLYGLSGLILTALLLFLAQEFQVLYSFLGDGSYCHSEVYRVSVDPGMQSMLFDKPTAYLTGHLLRYLASNVTLPDSRYPFLLISYAGIILLIPGLFYSLRKSAVPEFLLLLLVFLGGPAILFFFGYTELYTLQYVFLCLFFASGYRSIASKDSLWLPLAFLALSMGFGGSSLIYIPVALFIIVVWYIPDAGKIRKATVILIAFGFIAFLILLVIQWDDMLSPYIIPLVSGDIIREDGIMTGWFGYSMFSLPHVVDMLNALVFIGGAILIAGAASALSSIKSTIWKRPTVQFGLVAFSAGIILLLGGNASFGLARDWDLVVLPVLGIVFFGGIVIIELHQQKQLSLQLLLPALLAFSLGSSYAWVQLNHGGASAQRLEDLVDQDRNLVQPMVSYSGYENVRKYYSRLQRETDQLRILKKMISTGWHPFMLHRDLMTNALVNQNEAEREEILDWYFESLLGNAQTRYSSSDYRHAPAQRWEEVLASSLLLVHSRSPELATRYLEQIHAAMPDWTLYAFIRLALDDAIQRPALAERCEGLVTLDATDAHLVSRMGDFYRFAQSYQNAAKYYERALELDPHSYLVIYVILAQVYVQNLGDLDRGIETLDRCQQNCLLDPERPKVLESLAQLRAMKSQLQ
jgi:tetratricopeptide (TPR) repeat protein